MTQAAAAPNAILASMAGRKTGRPQGIGIMSKPLRSLFVLLFAVGIARADILYSNGVDPGLYSWQINFGYAVTDSFVLRQSAHVDKITLSIWDVDDLNNPLTAGWKITTQPFGGQVVASGESVLGLVQSCQENRSHFCRWEMAISVNVDLPAGTYWLQVDDVQTRFNTDAFWGQSGGPSRAFLYSGPNSADSAIRAIPSESFQVVGTNR